jgi:hypothetical protein
MDKRGVIGGMMVTFVATIIIVLILLLFVVGSFFISKVDGVTDGLIVYNETDVGLGDIGRYTFDYYKVANVRYYISLGLSLDDALLESGDRVSEAMKGIRSKYLEDLSEKYPYIK